MQRPGESINRQVACVLRSRRQAADQPRHIGCCQFTRFIQSPSHQPFGQGRAARDRGNTAFGPIAGGNDGVSLDPQTQPHDIATSWVLNFGAGSVAFKFAHVTRTLKVI